MLVQGTERYSFEKLSRLAGALKGIGELLNKLEKVKTLQDKSWMARCPSHPDKTPSLHISQKDETILLKCQAGCETSAVLEKLGLEMADLFIKSDSPVATKTPQIIATYDYQDEEGQPLFQVVRYEGKQFKQRHLNGSGDWTWNMDGVRRVLYHLPEIASSSGVIYLVEGEKDADNLRLCNLQATTSPGGANNWKTEYADYLKGKRVVVIPDKDSAGYAYAKQVVKSLEGKAQVKVIILPGQGKDATDWLDAGGDPESLSSLAQDLSVLFEQDKVVYQTLDDGILWERTVENRPLRFKAEKLSEDRTGVHARITLTMGEMPLSWSYLNVEKRDERSALATAAHGNIKGDATLLYGKDDLRYDLDRFCAGLWENHLSKFVPEDMSGDENPEPLAFQLKPFVLSGGGTIIFAPPGRGKSWTGLLWAVSIDAGCSKFWPVKQTPVLFINLERSAQSVRRRLSMVNHVLGLPMTRPLFALNARGRSLTEVLPVCRKAIKERGIGLVLLDSISRAGVGDLNENLSGNRIIDALSSLCPTWIALGHTSRANEEHMFGSIMQDAGADVCIQLSSQIKDEGRLGIALKVSKQNDMGFRGQEVWCLTFDDAGLSNVRPAKPFEFPEIESKGKDDIETTIIEWVADQDSGDASATEVSGALGYNRAVVSKLFTQSGKFVMTRKVKQSVYYGVILK